MIYGQQLQLGYDTLVCMQPLAQEFPKPLIARSSEDASLRRLPLPIPCSCLVDPVGSSTPFCTKQEHTAPPSCFSSLSGWEPWAPLPNSAQVCCFTFGYCKWNPLCLIQRSLQAFQEEKALPGRWGIVWGLKHWTKIPEVVIFPDRTRLAFSVISHELKFCISISQILQKMESPILFTLVLQPKAHAGNWALKPQHSQAV